MAVINNKTYESYTEEIDRFLAENFDKHYSTLEDFQKDIFANVNQSLKEIEEGKLISMENVIAEMEAKYNFKHDI